MVAPGPWPDRVHPDDRARVLAARDTMLRHGRPLDVEYRMRRADGTCIWVHVTGDTVRDAQGRAIRNFGAVYDIDARKRAEIALVDSRVRFAAILDSAMDGIVAFDGDGRVVLFNPAAALLLGRRALGVVGASVLALTPPRLHSTALERIEAVARRAADATVGGTPVPTQTVYGRHADGTEIPMDASISRIDVNGRRLHTRILREAHERRRLEGAERARAEAEAASRAKTEFLSRMSHELRTPLNAVLGFAQLLQRDPGEPLTGTSRERVAAIREAGGHLGALIDELLDRTLIEADRLRLDRVDVDLAALVRQSAQRVAPTASAAGVRMLLPEGVGASLIVQADPVRVRQVLVSLLGNAVKYNGHGGAVRLRMGRDGADTAWIEVEGDGPGIARPRISRVASCR
jgi:PAS domain S-box-containing protein